MTGDKKQMETEKKELPTWEDLNTEKLDAVELFDEKEHTIAFKVDVPRETTSTKYKGKRVMLFDVMENAQDKVLICTSIRLAIKLKELSPLYGKVITIQRKGVNTAIDYDIAEVLKDFKVTEEVIGNKGGNNP
jgi:hypothetical protein